MTDAAPGNGVAREAAASHIVVVIPTLDEEQSIADVVRSIPRAIVSRVIVADGGSRDATAARAKAAGADVIVAGCGYGRACLAATMAAEDALAQARRYGEAGASELVLTFAGRRAEADMQYLGNAARRSG